MHRHLLFLLFLPITTIAQEYDLTEHGYHHPVLTHATHTVQSALPLTEKMRDLLAQHAHNSCHNILACSEAQPFFSHSSHKDASITASAIGVYEKNEQPACPAAGDSIIGLSSSALSQSGLDQITRLIQENNYDISAKPPFATSHETFGQALMQPAPLYNAAIRAIGKKHSLKKIIPIDLISLEKAIHTAIRPSGATLSLSDWYVPCVFRWMKHALQINDRDMCRLFNCGIGMALVVNKNETGAILADLHSANIPAWKIGTLTSSDSMTVSGSIDLHAMKVLVIGEDARAHALAAHIAQSPYVGLVLAAPGNGGTSQEKKVHNIPINPAHSNALLTYAKQNKIDLIITLDETLLKNGFVDECTKKGLRCFGPTQKNSAALEAAAPEPKQSNAELISFAYVCDGETVIPFATTQHEPNCATLGAYSPAAHISAHKEQEILQTIIKPLIASLQKQGIHYCGFFTAEIAMNHRNPQLHALHCSLPDPDAQTIISRLQSDLFVLCESACNKQLDAIALAWDTRNALSVTVTQESDLNKEQVIIGIPENPKQGKIFHGATAFLQNKLVTNGKRVLCATGVGDTIAHARHAAYDLITSLYWPEIAYQKNIGYQTLSS